MSVVSEQHVAIGQPVDRVDGHAKVTGAGRYSAEIALPNMAHAVLIGADVASGRIRAILTSEAERAEGVVAVLTHRTLPKVAA
jgi:xanthine dehydrogenase YagR molybdenum-binding subunit